MWSPYRFLLLLLLIELTTSSRKFKRRETYLPLPQHAHIVPQPQHHHSQDHGNQPYQFEDVHPDEFDLSPPPNNQPKNQQPNNQPNNHHHRNHQNFQSKIQRYEHDLIGLHSSSGHGGATFLIDNGLRNIAKGSADQALGAVASQAAAGKQAAFVAISTLSQAAAQAAGTAVAALKGKEVLLQRLEEQSVDLHKSLENELAQLQQAKRSAKTAQYSAQQAINHVSVLTAALNNAQTASELAQKSASEAATELASQIDMVAQAKARIENIEGQLYAARLDYEETKEAAEKATLSAQEAQINANDAGAHANVELSDSVALSHKLHDKSDQLLPEASSIQETKREFPKRERNRRRNQKN